ncbi:UvrD-helicase domain-containing protein [Polluticoccus soli]|uniref:UvrD-helicase domain-containing protein n=1 Tax=Polluticoccus soli TaxID=3034150 RepID=UPI0023E1BC0B|nr:ATP-dependent helicase [Flavipsychrobacter sp. JY13-12]
MEPTEQQTEIINHDGNSVIIAAPGSGKTFVISEKIKLIFESLEGYQGVVAISYTNKASNELQSRCLVKGIDPKSSFFGTIDRFFIGEIIIPFGKQIFGIPSRQIEIIKTDRLPQAEQDNLDWLHRNLKYIDIGQNEIEELAKYFRNGLILMEAIGLLSNFVFHNSLACRKYLSSRYKYIFIDEYQDSGSNQHEIFLAINALGIVGIAVGDLNQSIYAFSGKSSIHLDNLAGNEAFTVFKLDKNHRCHTSIINYSNYLLDPGTKMLPTDSEQVYFKRIDGSEVEISRFIDSKIAGIKKHFGIINNSEVAILVRGNRTLEIIDASLQTPHKIFITTDLDTSLNVWSSIFSKLLHFSYDVNYRFMQVIEEFKLIEKLRRAELVSLLKLKNEIRQLFQCNPIDKNAVIERFVSVAKIIAPVSENETSVELLDQVLSTPNLLATYNPALNNELSIMTIHKSKGLEFEFVFHLDLYEWVLPQKGPGPDNDWDHPVYDDWAQDINLHYVAISRAKKACMLVSSTQRTRRDGKVVSANDSEFLAFNNIQNLWYKQPKGKP